MAFIELPSSRHQASTLTVTQYLAIRNAVNGD